MEVLHHYVPGVYVIHGFCKSLDIRLFGHYQIASLNALTLAGFDHYVIFAFFGNLLGERNKAFRAQTPATSVELDYQLRTDVSGPLYP